MSLWCQPSLNSSLARIEEEMHLNDAQLTVTYMLPVSLQGMLSCARDLPCNGHGRENLDFCSMGERTGHRPPYPVLYGGTACATWETGRTCLLLSPRSPRFKSSPRFLTCQFVAQGNLLSLSPNLFLLYLRELTTRSES